MYLTKIHVPPIMTEVQSKLTNILKISHKKSSLNVQWKSQHHIMSSRQEARAKERNTVLLTKQNRSGMEFRQSQFWMDPLFQSYLQQTVRFFLTKSEAAWLKDCSHLSYQGPDLSVVMLYLPCSCWAFWQFEKTFQIRIF